MLTILSFSIALFTGFTKSFICIYLTECTTSMIIGVIIGSHNVLCQPRRSCRQGVQLYHTCALRHVREHLTIETAQTIACSVISS